MSDSQVKGITCPNGLQWCYSAICAEHGCGEMAEDNNAKYRTCSLPLEQHESVTEVQPKRTYKFIEFWQFVISVALMKKARVDAEKYRGYLVGFPSPRQFARSRGFRNARDMTTHAELQRRELELLPHQQQQQPGEHQAPPT